MDNDKCCKNCDKCACSHSGHGMMLMDCCEEHKMSKEHLQIKKKMLEEKIEWVNEELKKK
jgi:hypothetical protein